MALLNPLSESQIQNILNEIPKPRGVIQSAVEYAHQNNLRDLERTLRKVKLPENPKAYDAFREKIIQSAYDSMISPGSQVGIEAATAIGSGVTQATLDSFKNAGSKQNVGETFKRMKALTMGSLTDNNPRVDLVFKTNEDITSSDTIVHLRNIEDVLPKKYELEMTTLDLLVKSWKVTMKEYIRDLRNIPDGIKPMILILNLDKYRMYTHHIIMKQIADVIENGQNVKCFWKSQRDGRMFIGVADTVHVTEHEELEDTMTALFFRRNIIDRLEKTLVGGIPGFEYIQPISHTFAQVVSEVAEDGEDSLIYLLPSELCRGVSPMDIIQFCRDEYDYEGEYDYDSDRFILRLHNMKIKKRDLWGQVIGLRVFTVRETNNEWRDLILWREDIDVTRLTTTHPKDMIGMFGLVSTRIHRWLLFRDLLRASDLDLNDRHIAILFMTIAQQGDFVSSNYKGLTSRNTEVITMSTVQKPMEVFMTSAMYGRVDQVRSLSSIVFTGSRSRTLGTGITDITIVEKKKTPLQEIKLPPSPFNLDCDYLFRAMRELAEERYGTLESEYKDISYEDIRNIPIDEIAVAKKAPKFIKQPTPSIDLLAIFEKLTVL